MKNMKKRGISPLIATVLLIGFTITVAAAVMIWAGDFIKEKAEKEGIKGEAKSECTTSLDIKLKDLTCGTNKIDLIIENKGSVDVGFIRVRVEGADESQTIPSKGEIPEIPKLSQKPISIPHTVSSPESVQIFPVIVKTKEEKTLPYTCSEKMIEANC